MTTQNKTGHTPTPWNLETDRSSSVTDIAIRDKNRGVIIQWKLWSREGDGDFIIRAVNSHEELLKAAKDVEESYTNDDGSERIAFRIVNLRKAIKQAERE